MSDEEVIKGLKEVIDWLEWIEPIETGGHEKTDKARTALELLKKRQPKPYESRKKLPCVCGKKRVETWWGHDSVGIICPECRRSVTADSEIGAVRAWNKAVRENTL